MEETDIISKEKVKSVFFIEPHSDDIALSAQGLLEYLKEKGFEITIVTVFTNTKVSINPRNLSRTKLIEDNIKIRTTEAENFAKICGVRHLSLELESKWSRVQDNPFIHNNEYLINAKKRIVKFIPKFKNSTIVLPSAIGNHQDHIAVRDLFLENKQLFRRIILYEEVPYVFSNNSYEKFLIFKKTVKCNKILIPVKNKLKLFSKRLKIFISQFARRNESFFESMLICRYESITLDENLHSDVELYERYWRIQ